MDLVPVLRAESKLDGRILGGHAGLVYTMLAQLAVLVRQVPKYRLDPLFPEGLDVGLLLGDGIELVDPASLSPCSLHTSASALPGDLMYSWHSCLAFVAAHQAQVSFSPST